MTAQSRQLLESAREALQSESRRALTPDQALELGRDLLDHSFFTHAAAVMAVTLERTDASDPKRVPMIQLQALATYKDVGLPPHDRLERALRLLEQLDLGRTTDQETLGLAGAIFRRRWEDSARRGDLEQSLRYYARGYRQGIEKDGGYTAINTAFVLDLLAAERIGATIAPPATSAAGEVAVESEAVENSFAEATRLRAEAARVRRRLADTLSAKLRDSLQSTPAPWWLVATIVEARVGLGELDEAERWLRGVDVAKVSAWERESTVRQLAGLVELRPAGLASVDAWAWLDRHFPREIAALRAGAKDRVGLALSGGGFRASLFHLGVLARLAELDVLRHVEVLSCVSGGSIVGAHYYLAVRHLLQTKADEHIVREDYIRIVANTIGVFLRGVRKNIRTHSLADAWVNARVLRDPQYSRTDRIAELLDECFYHNAPGVERGRRTLLRELEIRPLGWGEDDFRCDRDNWGRRNKVPTLFINAATLNTGHSWQFTPTWMGESPEYVETEVDTCYVLCRMYYNEAPPPHGDVPLSRAVAASACVPGLFPPVRLMDLYTDKLVALVDGGIHDNQGIAALLAENCGVCIVSDGSAQLRALDRPDLDLFSVGSRSMAVVQERLRESRYRELAALERGSFIRMLFLHLKQDIVGEKILWATCRTRPLVDVFRDRAASSGVTTPYGVSTRIQGLLASLRTDLDSFSEMEAYALMYDGYRIAAHYAEQLVGVPMRREPPTHRWPFLAIEPMMLGGDGEDRLARHLAAGAARTGKVFKLLPAAERRLILAVVIAAGLLAFTAAAVLAAWHGWARMIGQIGLAAAAVVTACVMLVALAMALQRRTARRGAAAPAGSPSLLQLTVDVLVLTLGWVPARLHLWLGNPAFLRLGRVKRLVRTARTPRLAASRTPSEVKPARP